MKKSRYPDYDVMREQDAWDDHSQSIVASRLEGVQGYKSLSLTEAEMLRAICSSLAGDNRTDIIQFVLGHIDHSLDSSTGESERKPSVPKAGDLLRNGMKRLNQWSVSQYKRPFIDLTETEQLSMIASLSEGKLPLSEDLDFPQKAFFNRLLSWTVESYYSHPTVWSEIGYGGPAYPRGYVRANIGQLDPWEAKSDT